MYVVVRKDLAHNHRAVQMCHAVEVWASNFADLDTIPKIVAYIVPDENTLKRIYAAITEDRVTPDTDIEGCLTYVHDGQPFRSVAFMEPDIGFEMTAICTDSGPFDLKLL